MSLVCGLVGLPNVGKSTLFNAIMKKTLAESANYPFCTIKPNFGEVPVEDFRLKALSEVSKSSKIVHALLSCSDIAGLVKGASKGEGLGNEFLGHIRSCDLIIHVVRCFEDSKITHVENSVDPLRDYEIINLELQFADIDKLDKILNEKKFTANMKEMAVVAKNHLLTGNLLSSKEWSLDFQEFFTTQGLLTSKKMLVVANMASKDDMYLAEKLAHLNPVHIYTSLEILSQEIEDENEKAAFIKDLGVENSGIDDLIKTAYAKLDLISYFTTGVMETRAWKIKKGFTMQQAAGVIHTDFFKHFISAEVVKFSDFIENDGFSKAKEKGLVRTCSKDTIVEDGDICLFKTFK